MIDFSNTEIAFKSKSRKDLRRAHLLFRIIASPTFVRFGKWATHVALKLRLPISGIIKATIFKQFCGGETLTDCEQTIAHLGSYKVGTILDYSVEGKTSDEDFDATTDLIISTILKAQSQSNIPFAVFKITGIGRFDLLEKASEPDATEQDLENIQVIKNRFVKICTAASQAQVAIFIDAEESWIQPLLDDWAFEMMLKFNKSKAIVYNTVQMYRHDRLQFIQDVQKKAQEAGIIYGVKLVRGAYMEKERARALELAYPSPIQVDKKSCDRDYNEALSFIVSHHENFGLCAGSHNEESCAHLVSLMQKNDIAPNHPHFYFSQLLGMSDHISFNLAHSGYNVAKYVPFGPVKEVLPYLLRRADENTSVAGQTSRELGLIQKEVQRRKG